jgi:hypothetical protein
MRFTRYTFLTAGIYGLLALIPMYFMETAHAGDHPPAIAHPEFYYGFVGVAIAFQLVFLIISRDPLKYQALILPSIFEKFSFAVAVALLLLAGRVSGMIVMGAAIDALLGTLFVVSWLMIRRAR